MQRLAVIRRQDQDGNASDAAVNAAHVRYIFRQGCGTYISFEDKHDSTGVTPIGVKSPDPVNIVIRRLNRPYWVDIAVRVGSLIVSAVGVILYIALS